MYINQRSNIRKLKVISYQPNRFEQNSRPS